MRVAVLVVSLIAAHARMHNASTDAADETHVFRGARVLTAAGEPVENGVLVVRAGKIIDVGAAGAVAVPRDAVVHDVAGRVIIPGLVDTHSHLGVYSRPAVPANSDGGEMSGPVQSVVRALDSINPFDPGIRMANAGGVTTANIMPGSGNVIGGQTLYVKLRGYSPEQMWLDTPRTLGGLKMANGENPKRSWGGKGAAPGTRMKVAALQRSEFLKAKQYQAKWERHRKKLADGEKSDPPDVDLALEPLVEALEGKRTVHFHSHRADDILTVLRLKREFGFDLLIQHGTEAYKVLDEIAEAKVPVSMTVLDSPGGKPEVVDFIEEAGAEMTKAGVRVLVNTDDPITESRFLLRTTAIPVRGGLSEDAALKSITLYPAQVMRIDDRVGSLEKGKDADFAVLSGPPFSIYTRVLATYIDGKKVFDLSDEKDRLYQTGGFAVAEKTRLPAPGPIVAPPPPSKTPESPAGARRPNAETDEFVVLAGRLHTVSGEAIADGAVHVRGGNIVYAGPRNGLAIPANVPVLTAAAVTPGLIDTHTVVPLDGQLNVSADQDSNEQSDPNQADVRVLDGFNPAEPLLRFVLEQGVTIVHACPGRSNVIAGQTGVFRTHGRSADRMAVRFPHAVLFNLGESPKTAYSGRKPESRMGTASLIRAALNEATQAARKREREEQEKKEKEEAPDEKSEKKSKKDDDVPPARDLKQEALALLIEKKASAVFVAQRADDCQTALRLIREFQLDGVLASAAEGYLIADQLAESKTPVIVHPTMQRIAGMETYHSFLGNAAALADAKLRIAISSGVEGYVPKTRVIRHEAGMAMVYGLGIDRALRAVTLDAARILKIDDRYGSLEPGKIADLVLYDGDPFEHATHVTHVVVDGRIVHDRASRKPVPLAQRLHLFADEIPCCLGW